MRLIGQYIFAGQGCQNGEACTDPDHVVIDDKSKIMPTVVTLTKALDVS